MGWSLALYNLLLVWVTLVIFPWLVIYIAISQKTRHGLPEKLSFYPADTQQKLNALHASGKPIVWFHSVSVGEFNAIRPLIDDLEPDVGVVISTTTLTGQTLARQVYPELAIFYFPLDFRLCVHRALSQIKPTLVLLTETELWPNFIDITTRVRKIPLCLINGRLSERSFKGYYQFRALMQPLLSGMTRFYMQGERDAKRICDLGAPAENIVVTGNIKFEINPTVNTIQKNILKHLLSFDEHDTVLVLASTHSGEDLPLVDTFISLRKDFPELKLVLAPRHPERIAEIRAILNTKSLGFVMRSQLSESQPNTEPIVVLDTIGELLTVFSMAHIAVIGGSFIEHGGHNPLEPLSQKIPVVFGPHMFNFSDVVQMILDYQAGYQAGNYEDVGDIITQLITQPERYQECVFQGQKLLNDNRGVKALLKGAIRQHLQLPLEEE
jgi:3-deoxy-D-manno-octulosonic-acid transferase